MTLSPYDLKMGVNIHLISSETKLQGVLISNGKSLNGSFDNIDLNIAPSNYLKTLVFYPLKENSIIRSVNKNNDHIQDMMTSLEKPTPRRYKLEASDSLRDALASLNDPVFVDRGKDGKVTAQNVSEPEGQILASAPALPIGALGDHSFQTMHGCQASFYAGSMANGIASPEMVIALSKSGLLGSYGSGGVRTG